MQVLDYVDTRQGTNNQHHLSKGNTLPYTLLPFGRHPFALISRYNDVRFFNALDRSTYGIRLTHQPSPWMGDFNFVNLNFLSLNRKEEAFLKENLQATHLIDDFNISSYNQDNAVFKPHHLSYMRLRDGLHVDLVPTAYGASFKVTRDYNYKDQRSFYLTLAISADGKLKVEDKKIQALTKQLSSSKNKNYKLFFTLDLNTKVEVINKIDYVEAGHKLSMYWLKLDLDLNQEDLFAYLNASYISLEQANFNKQLELEENNLEALDLDSRHKAFLNIATEKWLDYLNRIEIKTTSLKKLKTFYSALYRTASFPNKAYEYNQEKKPIHFSAYTNQVEEGKFFTNNGYWDTFRTNYPLYALIAPSLVNDFIEGILVVGREDKFLPRWLSPDERGLMPGSSVDAVIADAVVKDLVSKDTAAEILEYMLYSAETESDGELEGRDGGRAYRELGYIPMDIGVNEAVNKTLDYAYSDFCIAQVAEHIGREDIAKQYYEYSLNYRNLYNPELKRLVARDSKGNFIKTTYHEWGGAYTEGSHWQNSLSVFHNIEDLIDLYGGEKEFTENLIELVNQRPIYETGSYGTEIHEIAEMAILRFGQLAISNQPSFHIPYLFTYAGYPNYSELILKEILENLFSYDENAFPGDEDNGSMSAWYILSAIGLYQVCPGTKEYVLGINIFEETTIHLENGKKIHIKQDKVEDYLNVVRYRLINDKIYTKTYIDYEKLMQGLDLKQELAILPSLEAIDKKDRPHSLKDKFTD